MAFDITITNGQGSLAIPAGSYTATTNTDGFDDTTLAPTSVVIGPVSSTTAFTISATGTLTFTVNETGATGGTPITSGTIVMTDSTGTTQYGTSVDIGADGTATFDKVPFGTSSTPYTLYFTQLTSDSTHQPASGVITVSMTSNAISQFIKNDLLVSNDFTLTSADYPTLPVNNATITLEQATN